MERKNAEIRLERISNDFLGLSGTDSRTSSTLSGVRMVRLWPERPFLSALMLLVAFHLLITFEMVTNRPFEPLARSMKFVNWFLKVQENPWKFALI